jgi:hypothetical protein
MNRSRYSTIASTVALIVSVAALCLGGASAAGVFITTKDIRNGTITSKDIGKGAVKSTDIGKNGVTSADLKTGAVRTADLETGAVQTADIGEGQVLPGDVTMPTPAQLQSNTASATVGDGFTLLATAGTYAKVDPSSALEVSWTGTAAATTGNCIFQLRVDGQASANGAGTVFVASDTESTTSVAATALFGGLPPGPHSVEIWARVQGGSAPCIVGPAAAGIPQTFVVAEVVV